MLDLRVVSERFKVDMGPLSLRSKIPLSHLKAFWSKLQGNLFNRISGAFTSAALDGYYFTLDLFLLYLWVLPEVSRYFVSIHQG